MSDVTWERIGAGTGIVSVLLFVAAFASGVESPNLATATPERLRSFLVENSARLRLFTLLIVLSSLFLLWFLGSLRSALVAAEGQPGRLSAIAFGSGLLTVALYVVSAGLAGQGLDADIARYDAETARDIFVVGEIAFGPVGVGTVTRAALLGAASLVALRFGGLPKWLAWAGAVVAAASFVGLFTIVEAKPTEGPIGAVWFFSWLAFELWVLVTSIVLVVRAKAPVPATGAR